MHAPVSTVEHRGKQYILAYSSGNALIGSPRGDSVWLFGLDGTLPPVDQGVRVSRLAEAPPEVSGTARPRRQRVQPMSSTAKRCTKKPASSATVWTGKVVTAAVRRSTNWPTSRRRSTSSAAGRNNMPPFGQTLTAEQIRDIGTYVVEELPRQR